MSHLKKRAAFSFVAMDHYLIKERVVSSSDSCSVGLSAHIHFHNRLYVVARQLSTLDNPNTDLDITSNNEAAEQSVRQNIRCY